MFPREIHEGERARRRGDLYRKSGAIFAGVVLGSGAASHVFNFAHEYIGGAKAHATTANILSHPGIKEGLGAVASPIGGAPTAETLASDRLPVSNIRDIDTPPTAMADVRMVADQIRPTVTGAEGITHEVKAVPLSERSQAFLAAHEVKRGESIWKLAEKAVKDVPDMDGRSSERFAKLVELRLQEKLESNPDLARAAGFTPDAEGKFSPHHIAAKAQIELGKLLSVAEMTELIEEAKSDTLIQSGAEAPPRLTPRPP